MEATSTGTIDCPYCSEPINAKSKKCRHRSEILDPQMREIEMLKRQGSSQVFMNAGGAAASASAAATGSGGSEQLRRFPHWFHIIMTLVSAGLWIPIYVLMHLFRNKRYYY